MTTICYTYTKLQSEFLTSAFDFPSLPQSSTLFRTVAMKATKASKVCQPKKLDP